MAVATWKYRIAATAKNCSLTFTVGGGEFEISLPSEQAIQLGRQIIKVYDL